MKCIVLLVVLLTVAVGVPASSLAPGTMGRSSFELTPLPAWHERDAGFPQDTSSFFGSDDCCREGVEADGATTAAAAFVATPEPTGGFLLLAGLIVVVAFKAAGASAGSPGRKPRRR